MARFGGTDAESERKSGKRHAEAEQGGSQAAEELPAESAEEERVVENAIGERTARALLRVSLIFVIKVGHRALLKGNHEQNAVDWKREPRGVNR